MLILLLIPLMTWLNRVRGGGLGGQFLPGHPRYWVFAFICLLSFLAPNQLKFLTFSCGYLYWSLLPWGHWYSLGEEHGDDRPLTTFERIIDWLAGGNPYIAFTIRNAIGFLPLTGWGAGVLGIAQTALYHVAKRLVRGDSIWLAELLTGALWGVLAVLYGW